MLVMGIATVLPSLASMKMNAPWSSHCSFAGGGTLDLEELKVALMKLREKSIADDKEQARVEKAAAIVWKEAKLAQSEVRKQRKSDEDERKALMEAMAKEAERRTAEAVEAHAAREAAAEAARKKKESEKAEFERKIAQRRQLKAKS